MRKTPECELAPSVPSHGSRRDNSFRLLSTVVTAQRECVFRIITSGRRWIAGASLICLSVLSSCSRTNDLKGTLETVTGKERDPSFASKQWRFSDPKLQHLRKVMRDVRRRTQTPFEGSGEITVALQMNLSDMNHPSTEATPYLTLPSGKQVQLVVAKWETVLVGIDEANGWHPILRPSGIYKVVGTEKDGLIEVEHLELSVAPKGKDQFMLPVINYLPSTVEQMMSLTWIGDRKRAPDTVTDTAAH